MKRRDRWKCVELFESFGLREFIISKLQNATSEFPIKLLYFYPFEINVLFTSLIYAEANENKLGHKMWSNSIRDLCKSLADGKPSDSQTLSWK